MEMLRQKDLLLLGISAHEAEGILHLSYLSQAADKVVNTEDPTTSYQYWAKRGTYLADLPTEAVVNEYFLMICARIHFWTPHSPAG